MKILLILLTLLSLSTLGKGKIAGVSWHEGTVDSAFKKAKKENKSIFLYWGASWCPPCNHMKKKVFTTKIFADEMRKYVAVYLDGDEKRAQVWGEKLGAKGYPTMLVLNPSGVEITRLSTGMDAKKYVQVLEKARLQTLPISALLAKTDSLNARQWDILANYSWQQDQQLQKTYLAKNKKEQTFLNLYNKAPKAFKTKFFLQYVLIKKSAFTADELKTYRPQFERILMNDKDLANNFEVLVYEASSFVKALRINKKDTTLQSLYLASMAKYRSKLVKKAPKGRYEEKLMTYVPELSFFKINLGKDYVVSTAFQSNLEELVSQTSRYEKNKYARHSSLTSAVWLLSKAQLPKKAKALALQEIKTSPHPYYYMSYLSRIELDLKDTKSALKWSKKAWGKSVGHATRFEWGTSYLLKLIKHDGKNIDEIKATYQSLMSEFKRESKTFNGRSKRRLKKLKSSINKWNDKHPKSKITL
jgi:thioredoxin-related protein